VRADAVLAFLIRGFCRVFPDLGTFDLSGRLVRGLDVPVIEVLGAAGYMVLYAVPVLLLGIFLFRRREMP
jgi:hypothetical protein